MATEKRLIDANELMKAIKSFRWFGVPNTLQLMFDYLKLIIRDQPTVDAVEVVHSRWKRTVDGYDGYICSNCESVKVKKDIMDFLMTTGKWNFCPNCGAKMDGERKDNE